MSGLPVIQAQSPKRIVRTASPVCRPLSFRQLPTVDIGFLDAGAHRGSGPKPSDPRDDRSGQHDFPGPNVQFNFMVGIKGKSFSVSELAAVGVRRISLATSLYRAAMTGLLDAAREVKDTGQFAFLDRCVTTPELNKLMRI